MYSKVNWIKILVYLCGISLAKYFASANQTSSITLATTASETTSTPQANGTANNTSISLPATATIATTLSTYSIIMTSLGGNASTLAFSTTISTLANLSSTVSNSNVTSTAVATSQLLTTPSIQTTVATTMESETENILQNSTANATTSGTQPSIVERVKSNWETTVAQTNFNVTVLNVTQIKLISPSDFIDFIAEYYNEANKTELQSFLASEGVDDVAMVLLNNATILDNTLTDQYNTSQNVSLYGLLAALFWINDQVLNQEKFVELVTLYDRELFASVKNGSDNSTSQTVTTASGLVQFILSNASATDLLDAICGAAQGQDQEVDVCTPTMTTTTVSNVLPGTQNFESTWNALMSSSNYSFLSQSQIDELRRVTPENMTSGLIEYVDSLSSSDIQNLIDQNITIYVSSVLRRHGNGIDALGQEAIDTFGGNEDKEDVFYVYLNFLNNIFSQAGGFEDVLRRYTNATPSSTARSASDCDTTTITGRGLCCYTITTEGRNLTKLRDLVCDELNGGEACIISFNIDEEGEESPTSMPVSNGLSTGALVGIVIGGIAAVALTIIIIFFLWKRSNKKKSKVNPQEEGSNSDDMEMDGRDSSSTNPRARSHTNGHAPSRNDSSRQ